MMMDLLAYDVPDISFWDNVPWRVDVNVPAEQRIYDYRYGLGNRSLAQPERV